MPELAPVAEPQGRPRLGKRRVPVARPPGLPRSIQPLRGEHEYGPTGHSNGRAFRMSAHMPVRKRVCTLRAHMLQACSRLLQHDELHTRHGGGLLIPRERMQVRTPVRMPAARRRVGKPVGHMADRTAQHLLRVQRQSQDSQPLDSRCSDGSLVVPPRLRTFTPKHAVIFASDTRLTPGRLAGPKHTRLLGRLRLTAALFKSGATKKSFLSA